MDDEYILLPARRLHIPFVPFGTGGSASSWLQSIASQLASSTSPSISVTLPGASPIEVIDSVHENGPKLVRARRTSRPCWPPAIWACAWSR